MGFRDDRDAQLARAEALERENARLQRELDRRDAATRAAAETARAAADVREENAALREQLARAKGPGLARRIATRIAALRLDEPTGDGGYARAALQVWRLYVPILLALAITAAFLGVRSLAMVAVFAAGAPALAALLLLVPWLLRRRSSVVAGALAGAALGPPLSAVLLAPVFLGEGIDVYRVTAVGPITVAGALVTRGIPWGGAAVPGALFTVILAIPSPAHFFAWGILGLLGARLADPSFVRD